MKNKLFLFFLILTCLPTFSQDYNLVKELENNEFKIRQKPNTNGLLSNLLYNDSIQEDTLYAILYMPAECPRCEAAIPSFYRLLKDNSDKNKMMLITIYPDKATSQKYIKNKGYNSDYFVYPTEKEINTIFSFNTESLIGTYILKLCPKSGTMVTGGGSSILNNDFVCQLCNKKEVLPPFDYHENKGIQEDTFTQLKTIDKKTKWKISSLQLRESGNNIFISQVYDNPKFVDSHFFYSDMLENGIMLYETDNNKLKFRKLLQVDSTECDRFIQLPKEIFERQKKLGQVFYIALSANMINKDKIAISYSLPEQKIIKYNGQDVIAIYNHPAILIRDINTLKPDSMIDLDFDLEHSEYFHQHFTFDWFNNKLWMGCEKLTWPMDGFDKEEIGDSIEINPFDDRFYDTFNPIIASFDASTGKQLGHYGRLEDCQRKSKTGYYFFNDVYAHHGRDFVYGNGYTGSLYVCDSTDIGRPYRKYQAFEIDDSQFPTAVDTTKYYTLEYGGQFAKTFSRCIIEIKMDNNNIYCLIKHGKPRTYFSAKDSYVYTVINRKSGKRKEYLLPKLKDSEALGYGIRDNEGKFAPFMFAKNTGKYFVYTFNL